MPNERPHSAFISYSRSNKDFASKLAKELRTAGYPIWFDLFDIPTGSRWDDEVEKALQESSIFMIILTPASIASANVKDEIGFAIDHGKRILPILLENCDVPLRIRRFQYVDFTTKKFEDGIESAKELLKGFIEELSGSIPEPRVDSSPVTVSKKSMSTGFLIGMFIVFMLIAAGAGYALYLNGRKNINPPVVVGTATETRVIENPATETAIPVTESPVVTVPNVSFENGCIDSGAWLLIDGGTKNPDENNCWQLSEWGMISEKDEGLVFFAKNPTAIVSHGIFTSIEQSVSVEFDIQVNEMTTPSLLDTYIGFGLLPKSTSVPKNEGTLYYVVTDRPNAPVFIQLKAPGEDKYYLPDPPALKLSQLYNFKLEISGTYIVLYQDDVRIDERNLIEANKYFWIGFSVPDKGALSAVISNLSIETK